MPNIALQKDDKINKMNATKMKAIVSTGYGSPEVLQVQAFEKPRPKDNEVLIKIVATPVTAADTMLRTGMPLYARLFLGLTKPKNPIPGTGFAGKIETVGKDVTLFKEGDQVFGETTLGFSAHAEYVCVAETGVIQIKPTNMTFEEAAPVCDGAMTSLNFLRDIANIQSGQKVLINAASGSLGTSAIQLAKYYGAEVTGVCSSKNFELVKSLGADKVIDYNTTDFTKTGDTYDIIYDTIGNRSFADCKNALTKNGTYLTPVLSFKYLFQMLWTSMFGHKKVKFAATGIRPEPELSNLLSELKEMIEKGIIKSFIDRHYSLDQVVEAHRYVDTGRKRGSVVIRF